MAGAKNDVFNVCINREVDGPVVPEHLYDIAVFIAGVDCVVRGIENIIFLIGFTIVTLNGKCEIELELLQPSLILIFVLVEVLLLKL